MRKQVLVIGAGPAGMAAALAAAEAGASVTLLERRDKPGRKLLATGNGRCNLANRGTPVYFGDAAFAAEALGPRPAERLAETLERWGLALYTDAEGRVYPATQQAASVLTVLCARLKAAGVRLVTNADVQQAARQGDRFRVETADGQAYETDRLILATGGLAGGGLGNRRSDYGLAESLGHSLTRLFPGLSPLRLIMGPLKRLKGLRVPARLGLYAEDELYAAASGEILFAEDGISGICAMQLARGVDEIYRDLRRPALRVDLSPIFLPEERAYARLAGLPDRRARVLDLLRSREAAFGPAGILPGLVPDKLIPACPKGGLDALADFLTDLRLTVVGARPMSQAQVTCGGVDTREADPHTLASRRCPGLYLAGELLDVDGDCGGFNLQFALLTGLQAGRAAAR